MYRRHVFSSAICFMRFIQETEKLNEERLKENLEPYKIGLDIRRATLDGYEALGVYDLLTFHSDLNIQVRVLAECGILDLAILAGAPEGQAFISRSTQILPIEVGGFCWGEYKDLKLAEDSLKALRERIFSTITSSFNLSREALDEQIKEKTILFSEKAKTIGLRVLGETGGDL